MATLTDSINSYLQSVTCDFTPITSDDDFTIGHAIPDHVPDRFIIHVQEVESKQSHINTSKTMGPDDIPSWIWRDYAQLLAPTVCAVFNSSLREGFVPTMWKSTYTCAIPKVNPPTQLEKHIRTVPLTPALAKVMSHSPASGLWSASQRTSTRTSTDQSKQGVEVSLFKGSSTVHAIVELVHLWQQALDEPGKVLRVLLLDYSKTYDRVDHGIPIRKLATMDIADLLTRWLTSFLCGRRQCTKVGYLMSEWTTINAGVPQGTLFGLAGLVIHNNDLRTDVNIRKYVDDSSLWEVCDRLAGDSQLQRAADQALQWSENNHMLVDSDQTKQILVDSSRKLSSVPSIFIQDKDMERIHQVTGRHHHLRLNLG